MNGNNTNQHKKLGLRHKPGLGEQTVKRSAGGSLGDPATRKTRQGVGPKNQLFRDIFYSKVSSSNPFFMYVLQKKIWMDPCTKQDTGRNGDVPLRYGKDVSRHALKPLLTRIN